MSFDATSCMWDEDDQRTCDNISNVSGDPAFFPISPAGL